MHFYPMPDSFKFEFSANCKFQNPPCDIAVFDEGRSLRKIHRWIDKTRSSDSLNLELPTEMAEIKVAKKTIFSPGKYSWSSPKLSPR